MSVFSTIEQHIHNMEARHRAELGWIKSERTKLQRLLVSQRSSIQSLELNLEQIITNNSAFYREQLQLNSTVNDLLKLCSNNKGKQIGNRVIYCIYNTKSCTWHTEKKDIMEDQLIICSHNLLINSPFLFNQILVRMNSAMAMLYYLFIVQCGCDLTKMRELISTTWATNE